MGWTTSYSGIPPFILGQSSVRRGSGRQIDWSAVPDSYKNADGKKEIPAGQIMAELASGKVIPRVNVSGAETATCILETYAVEGSRVDAKSGYGDILGGVIYENLLPDSGEANFGTWKGELNAAGVGTGFSWRTWSDDSGS